MYATAKGCRDKKSLKKLAHNCRRHGARMPEAIPVFDDLYAITITLGLGERQTA